MGGDAENFEFLSTEPDKAFHRIISNRFFALIDSNQGSGAAESLEPADPSAMLIEILPSEQSTHPLTLESWNNLIDLYDAWNKPEKTEEWRAKLPQTEAAEE